MAPFARAREGEIERADLELCHAGRVPSCLESSTAISDTTLHVGGAGAEASLARGWYLCTGPQDERERERGRDTRGGRRRRRRRGNRWKSSPLEWGKELILIIARATRAAAAAAAVVGE